VALDSLPFEDEGKAQAMTIPKGDILHQFRKDVIEGKLPADLLAGRPGEVLGSPELHRWYGAWYGVGGNGYPEKMPEVWKKPSSS